MGRPVAALPQLANAARRPYGGYKHPVSTYLLWHQHPLQQLMPWRCCTESPCIGCQLVELAVIGFRLTLITFSSQDFSFPLLLPVIIVRKETVFQGKL